MERKTPYCLTVPAYLVCQGPSGPIGQLMNRVPLFSEVGFPRVAG